MEGRGPPRPDGEATFPPECAKSARLVRRSFENTLHLLLPEENFPIPAKPVKMMPESSARSLMLGKGTMKNYRSNEEFFNALSNVITKIQRQGNNAAADELRFGFSCLNGLTDGWALLMKSIEKTVSGQCGEIEKAELSELNDMLQVVTKAVYRN